MIINNINVNLILLTLPYDVVMMYWNSIKKAGVKYKICKNRIRILHS